MSEIRAGVRTNSRPCSNIFSRHAGSNRCLKSGASWVYLGPMSTQTPGRGKSQAGASGRPVSELPDGPPDATGLTPRQQRILAHLKDCIEQRGYPPSMREIGAAVGLTSTSSVAHQLKVLEEKGFLKRDPHRPRALEVFLPEVLAARKAISAAEETSFDETDIGDTAPPAQYVPLIRSEERRVGKEC